MTDEKKKSTSSSNIHSFSKENGKAQTTFNAEIYLVNFHETKSSSKIAVPGIDNLSLSHATCIISSRISGGCEQQYKDTYKDIMQEYSHTNIVLLSLKEAKAQYLNNLNRQMKKKQGSNDGSACLTPEKDPFSYLEPYEELQNLRESLESELDAETFETLYDYVSQVFGRRDQLKRFFKGKDQSDLIAEDIPDDLIGIEARLIGCVTYAQSDEYPFQKCLRVWLLSVRKEYQRCGVGRYLMKHVKNLLGDGLYDCITLTSVPEAISFYKKLGWKSKSDIEEEETSDNEEEETSDSEEEESTRDPEEETSDSGEMVLFRNDEGFTDESDHDESGHDENGLADGLSDDKLPNSDI